MSTVATVGPVHIAAIGGGPATAVDLGVVTLDALQLAVEDEAATAVAALRALADVSYSVSLQLTELSVELLALFGVPARYLRKTEVPRRSAMHAAYRRRTRHRRRR